MTERFFSEGRVLVVPGLHGSGEGHWQTRWESLQPHFERVEQHAWDVPDLDTWADNLDHALRRSMRPTLIVAHSFGCLTTVARSGHGAHPIVGALLVAPADPDKFGVAQRLAGIRLEYPSLFVGSENDPWMHSERGTLWAQRWGSRFINAGPLGHINADSRLGNWEQGWRWLQSLADVIRPAA